MYSVIDGCRYLGDLEVSNTEDSSSGKPFSGAVGGHKLLQSNWGRKKTLGVAQRLFSIHTVT
jgi:hypothetical protein